MPEIDEPYVPTDIDNLGGFLGGDEAEGYATLWVIATVVEKQDEDGNPYLGYDFPAQPAAVHKPPEITPQVGEKVTLMVRVPEKDKELWTKYASLTLVGDSKEAAEREWDSVKEQADYLPEADTGTARPVWKKKTITPEPE